MSLELINTLGTLTTAFVIAATAVAAIVQLRHMRAGNQINAMLSIGQELGAKDLEEAWMLLRRKLAAMMEHPDFRAFLVASARGAATPHVTDDYSEVRRSSIAVGNAYEELGILVKAGIVDRTLFLDRYSWIIITRWTLMQNLIGLTREAAGVDGIWENFEYLAVLSQDWISEHASTYPKGVRRMPVSNPWPIAAATS
jgi:hypothetical protein